MKVIVAGTRTITDTALVAEAIQASRFHITELVSGHCHGVDQLGEAWAAENRIPVKLFPFRSDLGKAGGPIRNTQMAKYADALIAVWDGKSRGTADMVRKAFKYGCHVYQLRITNYDFSCTGKIPDYQGLVGQLAARR